MLAIVLLALVAVVIWVVAQRRQRQAGKSTIRCGSGRIVPPPPPEVAPEDVESFDVWGFRDTRFTVNNQGEVTIAGSRYALSGKPLPSLFPWFQKQIDVELDPNDRRESNYGADIPPSRAPQPLLDRLGELLAPERLTVDDEERLRHGHGHTQEEMYAIKFGSFPRIPDIVVWPTEEDEVQALIELASKENLCLIPFGGGTNVTDALRCPADEERVIARAVTAALSAR